MKNILIIAAVFGAAFGLTMLLLLRDDPTRILPRGGHGAESQPGEVGDSVDESAIATQRRNAARRTMGTTSEPADSIVKDAGKSDDPTTGDIDGLVVTDDSADPESLVVRLQPTGGRLTNIDPTHFTVRGLQPAYYVVMVEAKGYASRMIPGVEIEAGRKYQLTVNLEKALVLRGIVVDDVTQNGIEGAVVDFNGQITVKTDRFGTFETTTPVTPTALMKVTVKHDLYDVATYVRQPFPDAHAIMLALSRGKGKIEGDLRFADVAKAPKVFRVRIWRPAGEREELRRENVFRDTTHFEIEGVFDGLQIIQIDFPGSRMIGRRAEFEATADKSKYMEFVFSGGSRVQGLLKSKTGLIGNLQVVLEDMHDHELATTMSDAEGHFAFDAVEPGDHRVRVDIRIPAARTDAVKVPPNGLVDMVMDLESGIATIGG